MGWEKRQRLPTRPRSQLFPANPRLQAASSPGPSRCRCRQPPAAGSGYCNRCHGSTCPSNAPVGGWGGPPPWPRLVSRQQKSGMFPRKSQPLICFKGPAPQLGLLVARWRGFQNPPQMDAPSAQLFAHPHTSSERFLWAQAAFTQCCLGWVWAASIAHLGAPPPGLHPSVPIQEVRRRYSQG